MKRARAVARPVGMQLLVGSALTLAVIGALQFAPLQLGGRTAYLATVGTSMLPRVHTGDLVVARPATRYHVGDAIAYRVPGSSVVTLHRIIADDGHRYIVKGDNNATADIDHPTRDQIIGRAFLRVPRVGGMLSVLARAAVKRAMRVALAALIVGASMSTGVRNLAQSVRGATVRSENRA